MASLIVTGCGSKATGKDELSVVNAAITKTKTLKSGSIGSDSSVVTEPSLIPNTPAKVHTVFFVKNNVVTLLNETMVDGKVQTANYNDGTKVFLYSAKESKNWVDTPKSFQKVDTKNMSLISKLFLSPPTDAIGSKSTKTVNGQKEITLNFDLIKLTTKNTTSNYTNVYKKDTYTYTINSNGYLVKLVIAKDYDITASGMQANAKENYSYALTDINKLSKLDRPTY